ncbi:hypothetical protein BGX28_004728 [Mortierella sp. GBA30]|nr:hypothetical protein BGX28_004728 [Mortierella sp. GBA30]
MHIISLSNINCIRLGTILLAIGSSIIGLINISARPLNKSTTTTAIVIFVADVLVVALYIEAITKSKTTIQSRIRRILLRLGVLALALFGPSRQLDSCQFNAGYDSKPSTEAGWRYRGYFSCLDAEGMLILSDNYTLDQYKFLRARTIVALTYCALMHLEIVGYCCSDEGTKAARGMALADQAPRRTTTNADVELGDEPKDEQDAPVSGQSAS